MIASGEVAGFMKFDKVFRSGDSCEQEALVEIAYGTVEVESSM